MGSRVFIALLVVVLAGCDNNPHVRPLQTERADGSPWIAYYLSLPEDPRTLDPQVSYDTYGNMVIAQIYESLLQYSPFKTGPFELEPCLAEGMPRHVRNADGTEYYEFRIKPGLFFHDDACFPGGVGREVTAADFVYTFQRIADPKVECPVLSTLQEFIVGLGDAYAEARKSGTFDYSKPTGAITVVDEYTFRLNLIGPYPQILFWLAMPFTAPVPREAVEYYNGKNDREQFKFHPVGTGPYRMVDWSRGRLIRMARHPRYTATRFPAEGWKADHAAICEPYAGAALPLIDELQFRVIRESISAWMLFKQGYLDRSGINKDVFQSVITANQTLSEAFVRRGVQLSKNVDTATAFSQFNMDDPLLGQNKKLRQALSMAYNQTRANEFFFSGIYINAQQILPPGVIGYQPDFKNPYRTENLQEAKRLLAEAGYPNGINPKTGKPLEITLDVVTPSAASRQMAEFDKGQIEQLGIVCKLNENTWASFQERQIRALFQMSTGSGWNADYPDPENFFFLFYSKNFPPQGYNHTHFNNPEFDRLYEQMAVMENSTERLAIIHRMNAILVEECPIILLSHSVTFALSQPWLPRIIDNSMLYTVKYAILDPELRAQKIREWNRTPIWPIWTLASIAALLVLYAMKRARQSNL